MAYLFGFTVGRCEIHCHQIVSETRGLDGFQTVFGGAGGFESPAKALDTRAVDLKLALSCHLAFRSGRLAGQLKINHLFYYSMISISNSLEYF